MKYMFRNLNDANTLLLSKTIENRSMVNPMPAFQVLTYISLLQNHMSYYVFLMTIDDCIILVLLHTTCGTITWL